MDEPTPAVVIDIPLPPGLPEPVAPRERLRWWQGLFGLLAAFGLMVVGNLIVLAAILLAQYGPDGVLAAATNPQALMNFPILAAGQVANLFAFVAVAVMLPLLAKVPHRSALGLAAAPKGALLFGAVGIIGLGPLSDRIVTTLKPYLPENSTLDLIEAAVAGQPLWLLVPILAVMPALGEELLCRGVLQRSIPSPAVALPVSAVLFALLHMDPLHAVGVLPLGFYLAWLGHRTRGVWVPIAAHFTNNLAATLAMYFGANTAESEAQELPLWAMPAGLLFCALAGGLVHCSMSAADARQAQRDQSAPRAETGTGSAV